MGNKHGFLGIPARRVRPKRRRRRWAGMGRSEFGGPNEAFECLKRVLKELLPCPRWGGDGAEGAVAALSQKLHGGVLVLLGKAPERLQSPPVDPKVTKIS